MRLTILALLFVLCGNLQALIVEDPTAGDLVDAPFTLMDDFSTIQEGRNHAFAILDAATENAEPVTVKRLFRAFFTSLEAAKIKYPPTGKDLKFCIEKPQTLAFVIRSDRNNIWLCAKTAIHTNSKFVGQILIHETAHVRGITDECIATKVEVAAMRFSGEGISFKNGYWKECEIL